MRKKTLRSFEGGGAALQVAGKICIAGSCFELQKTVLENDQLFFVGYKFYYQKAGDM